MSAWTAVSLEDEWEGLYTELVFNPCLWERWHGGVREKEVAAEFVY
jgi:hypothetical protein